MCLSKITQRKDFPREIKAYKVVLKGGSQDYRTSIFECTIKRGQWVQCDNSKYVIHVPHCSILDGSYSAGFHAFLRLEDAKSWCCGNDMIRTCRLRGITAIGKDGKRDVVVGQCIYFRAARA